MAGLFGGQRRLPNVDAQAMGISGEPQPYAGVQFAPQQAAQPKGGGTKRIVGILGDALLGLAGQQGVYGPMQHQRSLLEAREAAQRRNAQQQRQWGNEDWLQRQQWDRANPEPREPDAFERALAGANIDPTSQQGQQLFRARAGSMARDPMDEYVVVPIPGVGTYAGPRSGLADVTGGQRPRNLGPIVNEIPGGQAPMTAGSNFMTPAQFQAIVAAKGPAAAQEWARRNNIRVGN